MKLHAKTRVEKKEYEVDLEEVGSVYPDDDVIYFDKTPYYLSSVFSPEVADLTARVAELERRIGEAIEELQSNRTYATRQRIAVNILRGEVK